MSTGEEPRDERTRESWQLPGGGAGAKLREKVAKQMGVSDPGQADYVCPRTMNQ